MPDYIHGYTTTETKRLRDQATTLMEILHHDTYFESGSRILEVGCGVGAQTLWLARQNPDSQITAIDVNEDSVQKAQNLIQSSGLSNVIFEQSDLYQFQPREEPYDYIFISFVLEHLANPIDALCHIKSYLKDGGGAHCGRR